MSNADDSRPLVASPVRLGWQCPSCHRVYGPHVSECVSDHSVNIPYVTLPGVSPFGPPTFKVVGDQRCAFDGPEPGVYGLVCYCPKCSPSCVAAGTASA